MIVDALLKRQRPVRCKVYYYPELIRELSALRFDAERYERAIKDILAPELIVLDDFLDVIPKEDSFEEQTVLTLIKRRYNHAAPMIITTELTPETFRQRMRGHVEALFGRIIEMSDKRINIAAGGSTNYRFANYMG